VEIIAVFIGHAGNTLTKTLDQLTASFSTDRPTVERLRASRGAASPATDHNGRTHDYNMCKSLIDSLTDLAQSRLLGIYPAELDTTEQIRMNPQRTTKQPISMGPPHTLTGRARHEPRKAPPSRRDGGAGMSRCTSRTLPLRTPAPP